MKLHLGTLTLESPDFGHGDELPHYATADGEKESPSLQWSGGPAGIRSYALLSCDPDAPLTRGFDHWVVYNVPAGVQTIPRAAQGFFTVGPNGLGATEWCPAAPPPGHGTHYYYFHLYALAVGPDLPGDLDGAALLDTIDEHIIEQARLVGRYSR